MKLNYSNEKKKKKIKKIGKKNFKKEKYKKAKIYKEKNILDCYKNRKIFYTITSIFFFSIIIILLYHFKIKSSFNNNYRKIGRYFNVNDTIDADIYNQIIQDFIYINSNGTLIYDNKIFKKSKKPKISAIITVFNGEPFIKKAIRAVQNQDLLDIEIIVVEDGSKDKSLEIIKELMNEDPRIVLLSNNENRGNLYSLKRSILTVKGKYIIILDVDDYFAAENAFSTLYFEAEKNSLDILGFTATQGYMDMNTFKFTHTSFHHDIESPIIYQPELREMAFKKNNQRIIGSRDTVWGYLFRSEFAIKATSEIDDEKRFFAHKINGIGDIFLFNIFSKRAKSLKYLKKIFYVTVQRRINGNSLVKYFDSEKYKIRDRLSCYSSLTFADFVLYKSENDRDFEYSSFLLENDFLNNGCRKQTFIRNEAIRICKLFLESQYINSSLKGKINAFLNEVNRK